MNLYRPPTFLKLIYNQRIWGFSSLEPTVYLTFDDGPRPEITPWILDLLKAAGIKATFFCVGENVERYPEIYQRIINEGHSVGNHTQRHDNASVTSATKYVQSVRQAQQLIASPLFRPPYGRLSPRLARKLAHDYRIIMWTWLSYDFDPKVSCAQILERAHKQIKNGDIIVLHDNAKTAEKQKELLPDLLAVIQKNKLNFAAIPMT